LTATKEQIQKKATELYMQQQYRSMDLENTPEPNEILESGILDKVTLRAKPEMSKHDWDKLYSDYQQTEKHAENLDKFQCKTEIPLDIAECLDTGAFVCGTSQSGKTTLAKHLAKRLMEHGVAITVLDVSRAWAQETPISNVVRVPHNGMSLNIQPAQSTVYDLSELSFEERFRFVNAFTATLYQWHKSFGYKRAPFGFIFYEEAQTYLPNGCFRSYKKYAPLIDLVTVGANFNLRFGLITQFPAMVDKAPVKIAQQRYFGWTTEKNDIDYVQKFIGKDWVSEIKSLQKGQFLYQLRSNIHKFQVQKYGSAMANGNRRSYCFNWAIV
jgi:hypothetical protein